jgi:hypothetical protein
MYQQFKEDTRKKMAMAGKLHYHGSDSLSDLPS